MTQTLHPLDEYFAALERLKTGKTLIVPKGTRITKDAVSLEAGRVKGSIKKSRDIYGDLIVAIEKAAVEKAKPQNEHKAKLEKAKASAEQYHVDLESALAREVSLLKELYETKKQLAQLTGAKVLPLRGKSEEQKDD